MLSHLFLRYSFLYLVVMLFIFITLVIYFPSVLLCLPHTCRGLEKCAKLFQENAAINLLKNSLNVLTHMLNNLRKGKKYK